MAWIARVLVEHEILISGSERPNECDILSDCYGQGDIMDVSLASLKRVSLAEASKPKKYYETPSWGF